MSQAQWTSNESRLINWDRVGRIDLFVVRQKKTEVGNGKYDKL